MIKTITVIAVGAILLLFSWLARRRMANAKLTLPAGEQRLGEMWGRSRDVTFGGLVLAGDATTGKVVLTSRRLLWVRLDEKKIGLALGRDDLERIEVAAKGFVGKEPALVVHYRIPGKKKPRKITFTRIEAASGPGLNQSFGNAENPSIEAFAATVDRWRAVSAA